MRLQVKGTNVEVSEPIRLYAEGKLRKLERHLHELTHVELELRVEKNPSIADDHIAEATIWTKGPVLRARESSTDMKASIDQLVDKLARQAQRYREKRRDHRPRVNGSHPEGGTMGAQADPQIVKSKQFALQPMSAEEAVLQLELVGHDFFVFQTESGGVNVVYRRKGGGYGLIEPQT